MPFGRHLAMKLRNRLFSVKDPYDTAGTEELFAAAMRENCAYQYRHNPGYRAILDADGFSPDDLHSPEDLEKLPVIPTAVFKKHDLNTKGAAGPFAVTVTSSGTSGKQSSVKYDVGTLLAALKMVLKVTAHRGLLSLKPANYIVFGYKPHKGNKTAVTRTATGTTFLAPALKRVYALRFRNGTYEADLESVIEAIQAFSRSRFPTRFIGFPSYTWFAMKQMEDRGLCVSLPAGSKIMLGGGWKQFYKEKVDKVTFYQTAKDVLGVDEKDIVEFFGAAEHAILYCDCPNHHFHIPVYGRAMIRDVYTLKALGKDQTGLINLMTPMVRSAPLLSIMTDDLGVIRDGSSCGCGCTSPYLEIIGRVGLADIMTCAAGAAEKLK